MFESVSEGRSLESWLRNPREHSVGHSVGADLCVCPEAADLRRPGQTQVCPYAAGSPDAIAGAQPGGGRTPVDRRPVRRERRAGAVLRTPHPRGEPRATVGLAAQLFCRDQRERRVFRDLVETGALTTSGALRIVGDAPFFERSLQPAEALWPALHGLDVWPASIIRLDDSIACAGLDEWFATASAERAARGFGGETCTVLVTADNEETAYYRATALVAHAGAKPAGILACASGSTAQVDSGSLAARGAAHVESGGGRCAPVDASAGLVTVR